MTTAKVFENGRSQAVRIPKEYRFSESDVYVNRVCGVVMLMPKNDAWAAFEASLSLFTEDFFSDGREQVEQEREDL